MSLIKYCWSKTVQSSTYVHTFTFSLVFVLLKGTEECMVLIPSSFNLLIFCFIGLITRQILSKHPLGFMYPWLGITYSECLKEWSLFPAAIAALLENLCVLVLLHCLNQVQHVGKRFRVVLNRTLVFLTQF